MSHDHKFSIGLWFSMRFSVLFTEPLGYHFGLVTWCFNMMDKALFISNLLMGLWKKLLLEDVLVTFLN